MKDELRNIISGAGGVRHGAVIQAATRYLRRSQETGKMVKDQKHYKEKEAAVLREYIAKNNLWLPPFSLASSLRFYIPVLFEEVVRSGLFDRVHRPVLRFQFKTTRIFQKRESQFFRTFELQSKISDETHHYQHSGKFLQNLSGIF